MPVIQNSINNVQVKFSSSVNNNVDQRIIEALKKVVKNNIAPGYALNEIFISSANDQHQSPSRHVQGNGKAIDISRINAMKMSVFYPNNAAVKAIVEAMQLEFENYVHRRENYGPYLKKKHGNDQAVPGHADHIHFSVN